jgi:hypothetical protein
MVKAIGHPPRRDLRLVGTWQWSSEHPADRAEWYAGTLYVGCLNCLDDSPDHLRIMAIMGRSFWGTWDKSQGSLVKFVDKKGKPLPNPKGYFCAEPIDKA